MTKSRPIVWTIAATTLLSLAALLAPPRHAAGAAPAADKEKPKAKATFEVYQDKAGGYRWRLRAQNTKVLATSSESYKEKRSCLAGIDSVKRDAPEAPVVDEPAKSEEPAEPAPKDGAAK
jgi:uncharacterized protein YegP (UPF0339 family)